MMRAERPVDRGATVACRSARSYCRCATSETIVETRQQLAGAIDRTRRRNELDRRGSRRDVRQISATTGLRRRSVLMSFLGRLAVHEQVTPSGVSITRRDASSRAALPTALGGYHHVDGRAPRHELARAPHWFYEGVAVARLTTDRSRSQSTPGPLSSPLSTHIANVDATVGSRLAIGSGAFASPRVIDRDNFDHPHSIATASCHAPRPVPSLAANVSQRSKLGSTASSPTNRSGTGNFASMTPPSNAGNVRCPGKRHLEPGPCDVAQPCGPNASKHLSAGPHHRSHAADQDLAPWGRARRAA